MTGRRVRAARNLIASDDVNYSLILLVWNPTKFRYATDVCASNTCQWERAWSWLREPCRSLCRNWLHLHLPRSPIHDHPCDGCWLRGIEGAVQEVRYARLTEGDDSLTVTSDATVNPGDIAYIDGESL